MANPEPPKNKHSRPWRYFFYLLATSYLLSEMCWAVLWGISESHIFNNSPIWIIEQGTAPAIRFDRHTGFRYNGNGTRHALVSRKLVDYDSHIYGNNLGFPDKDAFFSKRQRPGVPRIAVLGDSFSAALSLETNWPDRLENMAEAAGTPVELLNFSLDGAGTANWWGIVTHILQAESYELDGILFGLFNANYRRQLIVADHEGYERHMSGYVPSFNPEDWPQTAMEARSYLSPMPSCIVSSEAYERALKGSLYALPSSQRWEPVGVKLLGLFINSLCRPAGAEEVSADFENYLGDIAPLFLDIKKYAQTRQLASLVMRIPYDEEILGNRPPDEGIILWAKELDAPLFDGLAVYKGMTEEQVRTHFFKMDGHWNQKGSDAFADYFFQEVVDWAYSAFETNH